MIYEVYNSHEPVNLETDEINDDSIHLKYGDIL